MSTAPASSSAWVLKSGQQGLDGLHFVEGVKLPQLGEKDVLVKLRAASLNYREVVIAKGLYGTTARDGIIPGSDGAGIVEAVGTGVSEFRAGDKVCMHRVVHEEDGAATTFNDLRNGLREQLNGTLSTHGVFPESCLVRMPSNLNFLEAATLTVSGLTAWNSLFGLKDKALRKGQVVLVQGTGGVSIAALQFAVGVGATVIATTSSDAKVDRLKTLGAQHVINYKTTPNWGEVAKGLTPNRNGVDVVVGVGGSATLGQSILAVRPDGLIALAGILGGAPDPYAPNVPTLLSGILYLFTARGFLLGNRDQFKEMNRFVEEKNIRPVLDDRSFKLMEIKEAYEYLKQQKHFSKIGVEIC